MYSNFKKLILIFLFLIIITFCESKKYDILKEIHELDNSNSDEIFHYSSGSKYELTSSHSTIFENEEINFFTFIMKFRYNLQSQYSYVLFELNLYTEKTYLSIQQKYPDKKLLFCFGTRNRCMDNFILVPEIFDGKWHDIFLNYNSGNVIVYIDCKEPKFFNIPFTSLPRGTKPINTFLKLEGLFNFSMDISEFKLYSDEDYLGNTCQLSTTNQKQSTMGVQEAQAKPGKRSSNYLQSPEKKARTHGSNGDKGPAGEAGNTGLVGFRGLPGSVGPRGITGPKGERGQTGLRGPKGEPGLSQISDNHFEVGLPGNQGPKGTKGDKGYSGILSINNINKNELKSLILEVFEEFLISGDDTKYDENAGVLADRHNI